jgi:DNA-binding response OmpR family regulator
MRRTTILVVDDDPSMRELLGEVLETEGWRAVTVSNGDEALKAAAEQQLEMALLDILMPGMKALQVCRELTSRFHVPVIIISGIDSTGEKVTFLNAGADDYLTKPFQAAELIARIEAVFRQRGGRRTSRRFAVQNLQIDLDARKVKRRGREIKLTPTEFRLLEELVASAGKTVSYRHLLSAIWGGDFADERGLLYVHMGHLRRKLNRPGYARCVLTVPGVGYCLGSSVRELCSETGYSSDRSLGTE